jgi:hypothetical protein
MPGNLRELGKQTCRWEDNIKMYRKKDGVVVGTGLKWSKYEFMSSVLLQS